MEGARVTSQHFSHLGYFNISIELEAYDFELESETMFECVLTIPHTGYQLQEKIVYFPGQIPTLKSTKFFCFLFLFFFIQNISRVFFASSSEVLPYFHPTYLPAYLPSYIPIYLRIPIPYFLIPCHLPCVCVLDVCVVCVCSTLKLPSNLKPGILKTEYDERKGTFHSITFWGTPKPVNYIMNEI